MCNTFCARCFYTVTTVSNLALFCDIVVVCFVRWHMTPADVNAYYNSPNNYIG